ncbi:unnamed protein product [Owenia fusiformis]|uniref:Cytochrome c oxidase subunit 5A, mitochondrial n=1 Tax=Owenia fusiformis TaxID=6347 RepID=A0A8J1TUK6_OWEFU|nr:unnamed protein product [Owenia fusiformis]
MFRSIAQRLGATATTVVRSNIQRTTPVVCTVRHGHGKKETDEEVDARYEALFNNPELDGWMFRKACNDLQGMDMVPEPRIIVSALKAARRLNDYSLTTRYLEAVKAKCGNRLDVIWPYILQEIRPTLDELGISTPEELGFDKPELAVEDVQDIH